MRDLNRNPRERSVNAFCFGEKKNLSEGGLKRCGWVSVTDITWRRFGENR